ncbi:pro-opiomelanocortin-like [Trematomus bernacchii]|uniref:pro-opiomelanocortin-like n=1 Tax=Trematomus bernacchii TaxID=40690 RepID=UPI00146C43B3|nr:pro-opiomelanocortin-like [Trematomus bernacchii]XP_033978112.1 pro-opiomelanocortin-like [Trematomus bernacchii]
MFPTWLLVVLVVVGGARGAVSQCWEHPSCQDLSSESSMLLCIQLCHDDLTAETPVIPGPAHLQPPPPLDSSPSPSSSSSPSPLEAKRSYTMEHFRWGKPVGRKRHPVKVFSDDDEEGEEPAEEEELRRRGLKEEEEEVMKKDGSYKMKHFRWGSPPKRYGGFMKSWDERNQRPLITLFKNVINKSAQQ